MKQTYAIECFKNSIKFCFLNVYKLSSQIHPFIMKHPVQDNFEKCECLEVSQAPKIFDVMIFDQANSMYVKCKLMLADQVT